MMRAGKDYVAGIPEYEDKRSAHLRELVRNLNAQGKPPEEAEDAAAVEAEEPPKLTNQNKPTLKLTK